MLEFQKVNLNKKKELQVLQLNFYLNNIDVILEIHDYNFKTGKPKKSGDVVGHFTQLVWKDSKEVGFGIAFNGNVCFGVANYYPGGNFNNLELEQVGNLIEVQSKSCKDLFQLESVLKRELDVINEYRKMHQVDSLELDRTLCNKATSHAEYMGKTGNFQVYEENGKWENWTNWTKMNLIRGAVYKGGEGVKKWYKLLKDYDIILMLAYQVHWFIFFILIKIYYI